MLKFCVFFFAALFVIVEARPKWQFLPPVPGYIPVYIRTGDTPLEEINPDLAEAFHAIPAGRSAGKQVDADPEDPEPETNNIHIDKNVNSSIDRRPFEKKVQEKKVQEKKSLEKKGLKRIFSFGTDITEIAVPVITARR